MPAFRLFCFTSWSHVLSGRLFWSFWVDTKDCLSIIHAFAESMLGIIEWCLSFTRWVCSLWRPTFYIYVCVYYRKNDFCREMFAVLPQHIWFCQVGRMGFLVCPQQFGLAGCLLVKVLSYAAKADWGKQGIALAEQFLQSACVCWAWLRQSCALAKSIVGCECCWDLRNLDEFVLLSSMGQNQGISPPNVFVRALLPGSLTPSSPMVTHHH